MKAPAMKEKEITTQYAPQIKTLQAVLERRRALTPSVWCHTCGKTFKRSKSKIRERNYCSRECSNKGTGIYISKKLTGKIMSEITKEKLRAYTGARTSNWKGGKPNCKICGKQIRYDSEYCNNHKYIIWTPEHWAAIHNGASNKLTGKMPKNITGKPGKYGNVKRDWYEVNGKRLFFRSKWEVNYALYLDFLIKNNQIKKWEYEADVFIFDKINFGTRSYRPDFKITNMDDSLEYHEIKGWMTSKSKTQINRMAKYYPHIKLILIQQKEYSEIVSKVGGLLRFY
jgi:hypothetical protein